MSDEQVARRRFLQLAGRAAVTAPATSLLLAASTQMALPYGALGTTQPSSFSVAEPGLGSDLSIGAKDPSPTDLGAHGIDERPGGQGEGAGLPQHARLPGAVKPGKEFMATGEPPPITPPW